MCIRDRVKAVNGVSFKINEGETVCVVGESGCGKSVTALSLMRLVQTPPGEIVSGEIIYNGRDLLKADENDIRHLNGNEISMIFQEPMTSLNPVFKVGEQIAESIMLHEKLSPAEAKAKAINMIELVNIPRAAGVYESYPHQLSGGMRQRIMTAMALSCNPKLLIADEPTTALDVTIQAQILDLIRDMKKKLGMSVMLITHDLGVVAEMADYVVVMYAGKVIEEGPVLEIFKNTKHPYTLGLLKSKPVITNRQERLYSIPGQVPNPIGLQDSCYFHGRCEHCMDICTNKIPPLMDIGNGHKVACRLFDKEGVRA
ncbi:MAG: ABC transporter ATP-binding protein [Clostridia bacterium]|nr:ABC transporter ATP-binding protein [Clostridia bacterium]